VNAYLPKEFPRLKPHEVLQKAHIVIGESGKCMCGIYGEHAFTCSQIISEALSEDVSGMDITED
jgi:hypothetical protein